MKKICLLVLFFLALVLPVSASADGGLMVPPEYWMRETIQKAAIVFENGTETLVLSTTFEGDAKDFAWIIPTPTQPQVTKAPYNLFESLEELTRASWHYYSGPYLGMERAGAPSEDSITIYEQKRVDIYDITVLSANDKNALYDWLKDHGYNYPQSGKYILDDYIQNGWVFTAVKIDSENLSTAEDQLHKGTANPLKLVFKNDKIVYPLKMSAITTSPSEEKSYYNRYSNEYVPIELYVFADHKKEAIGFNTDWAGWVKSDEIKKLGFDSNGNPWYDAKNKMYLTKLSNSLETSEMKNDVFPVNAKNNSRVPPSNFWPTILAAFILFIILLFTPTSLLYVIFLLLFTFSKSRVAKISFLIVQCFLALAMPILALVIFSSAGLYSGPDDIGLYGLLISSVTVFMLMITGIVIEIVKFRKLKLK